MRGIANARLELHHTQQLRQALVERVCQLLSNGLDAKVTPENWQAVMDDYMRLTPLYQQHLRETDAGDL